MGLGAKLNLVLICVFAFGVALFYFLSGPVLKKAAEEEVLTRARIMMEGAAGVRKYTADEVAPLLTGHMREQFHRQSVAAYAATRNFEVVREQFPEYSYREVALNPTNLESRALDWEADIINDFRASPGKRDLVTHRSTAQGELLHLSRPIIAGPTCLVCHGRSSEAPRSMLAAYGKQNGFGWRVNEIIGAQIVSVPMAVPLEQARETRLFFVELLVAVFVVLAVVLNVLLRVVVLDPITRMSHVAGEVSMGKTDVPEYHSHGSDEIASLSASFNRMRRTVEEALKLLSDGLK